MTLPLDLSHQMLAELACAQRPSVTKALHELARYRLVVRRPDGGWTLHASSPADVELLERLGAPASGGRRGETA